MLLELGGLDAFYYTHRCYAIIEISENNAPVHRRLLYPLKVILKYIMFLSMFMSNLVLAVFTSLNFNKTQSFIMILVTYKSYSNIFYKNNFRRISLHISFIIAITKKMEVE